MEARKTNASLESTEMREREGPKGQAQWERGVELDWRAAQRKNYGQRAGRRERAREKSMPTSSVGKSVHRGRRGSKTES